MAAIYVCICYKVATRQWQVAPLERNRNAARPSHITAITMCGHNSDTLCMPQAPVECMTEVDPPVYALCICTCTCATRISTLSARVQGVQPRERDHLQRYKPDSLIQSIQESTSSHSGIVRRPYHRCDNTEGLVTFRGNQPQCTAGDSES